jgi:uncharacterized protein with von Willebrand factor type A (vWA) domain
MNFLTSLLQRYADVVADQVTPTATDAVPHDRFDEATWADVRSAVPSIDTTITDLSRQHDYVEDFAQDAFQLLAKGDPTVREAPDMRTTHVPNRAVIDTLAGAAEVQHLRSLTANDPYAAAMAWVSMREQITDAADRMQGARQQAEQAEQAEQEARDAAERALRALQDAQDAHDAADREDPASCEQAAHAAQQAEQQAQTAQEAAGQALAAREATEAAAQQVCAGMRQGVRQAAKAAAAEREEEAQLMDAFGVDAGELKRMDFKARADLARRLAGTRLAQFSQLIGQFKQMASAQARRRVQHAADEIVGVTLGDDLQRLTMGELVNLATPELEDDFWLRYVQRELVVYDLAGTERLGQGPIVVVNDESGSMKNPIAEGATREAWSKALSLALLDQARRQGRDFVYIGFSSASEQHVLRFPAGRSPVTQVITMVEHFFDGGTHYVTPLQMALDVVERDYADRNLPRPDVVVITDERSGELDEAFVSKWRAAKARLSLRCFGIALVPTVNGVLQAIADDVRSITSLTADPRHVADVFRMI